MKRIRFSPNAPAEVRSIDKESALRILKALHRYAETGQGDVKALTGEFSGLFRLRAGHYRVIFEESVEVITVHRVAHRGDVYR